MGVLRFRLLIRESRSLKDKRRIVRGIKDRVRSRLNAAIVEIESQDHRQRAALAAVTVSNRKERVDAVLSSILAIADRVPGAERFDTSTEYL